MKLKMSREQVELRAKHYGWSLIDYQEKVGLISFYKEKGEGDMRINIYLSKMTVGTCLNHPTQGKTQLFRKHVDEKLLNDIFDDPRVHTLRGYKNKR